MFKTNARRRTVYLPGGADLQQSFGAGGVVTSRTWTLSVGDDAGMLVRFERTEVPGKLPVTLARFALSDLLRSVTVEVDDAGNLLGFEQYTPYGDSCVRVVVSGAAGYSTSRYRFNGKERDVEETGLYYYGARYYACWLGRWVSCDPSVDVRGSAFGFCSGNPVSLVDLDGRQERPRDSGNGVVMRAANWWTNKVDAVWTDGRESAQYWARQSYKEGKSGGSSARGALATALTAASTLTDPTVGPTFVTAVGTLATLGAGAALGASATTSAAGRSLLPVLEQATHAADVAQAGLDVREAATGQAASGDQLSGGERGARLFGAALIAVGVRGAGDDVARAGGRSSARVVDEASKGGGKFVPNPGGKLGDQLTRQRTADLVQQLESQGYRVEREVLFQTPGGFKGRRFADVVATDPSTGVRSIFQIGRTTKGGVPVMRERKAILDIFNSPDARSTDRLFFIDKITGNQL